jgi:glycosyltransferase involved in cell wall biosynthesis
MKITFLLPVVGWSGGIRVVAIYAQWLAEHGHDVVLVSQAAHAPTLKQRLKSLLQGKGWLQHRPLPASYLDGLGLEHRVVPAGKRPGPADVPPADVLISTWWETAEWAAQLPDSCGARVYFVQHHELFDFVPRERCEATYRLPFYKVVIAQWLADVMASQYNDKQVDLVPNGVDPAQFHAPLRGKQPSPTVGMLYHEASFKGTDVALETVTALKAIYPDLRVVAFGGKPPTGIYSVPSYVELHVAPPQDTLRTLYASCDVWLTTSRSEGFNLMAMEAMACRTPVVSTRTGWPVEGINSGKNGYLVDVDDAAACVAAVAKVLDLPSADWQAMSEAAWDTVKQASWEQSCLLFESTLADILRRSKTTAGFDAVRN